MVCKTRNGTSSSTWNKRCLSKPSSADDGLEMTEALGRRPDRKAQNPPKPEKEIWKEKRSVCSGSKRSGARQHVRPVVLLYSESESWTAYSTASLLSRPDAVRYLRKAEDLQPPALRMAEMALPDSSMSEAIPRRKECHPRFDPR